MTGRERTKIQTLAVTLALSSCFCFVFSPVLAVGAQEVVSPDKTGAASKNKQGQIGSSQNEQEKQENIEEMKSASALFALAGQYAGKQKYAQAEPIAEQAVAAAVRAWPENTMPVWQARLLLAECQLGVKKTGLGQKNLQIALGQIEAATGSATNQARSAGRGKLWLRAYQAGKANRDGERLPLGEQLLKLALALSNRGGQSTGGSGAVLHSDVVYALGVNYLAQGRYDEALEQLETALCEREKAQPIDRAKLADCYFAIGATRQDQGRLAEAETNLRRALEIRKEILAPGDQKTMASAFKLGQNLWQRGQYEQAIPLLEDALARVRASEKPNDALAAEALYDLGWAQLKQGQFAKAIPYLQEALAVRERTNRGQGAVYLGTLHDLAMAQAASGHLKDAEVLLKQMRELVRKLPVSARSIELILLCQYELGLVLMQQDRLGEAQTVLKEVLAFAGNGGNPEQISALRVLLAQVANAEGLQAQAQGKLALAVELFEDALEEFLQVSPRDYSSLAAVLTNLGDTCVLDGNDSDALQCYDKAIEISTRAFPADSPILAGLLQAQAAVLCRQARYDAAGRLLKQAQAIWQKTSRGQESDREALYTCNQELANVLRCLGEYDQAIKLYSEVLAHLEKGNDAATEAICWQGRGLCFDLKGNEQEARADFERAVQAYDRFLQACLTRPSPWQDEARALKEKVAVHLRQKAAAGASEPDFLASVKGFRWQAQALPLRVYVRCLPEPGGFSAEARRDFVRAMDEWCAASGAVVKYALVNEPKDADIVVENLYHSGLAPSTVYGATNYESIKCRVGGGTEMRVRSGIFCPYESLADLSAHEKAVLHAGFLHEIGHMLGFIGHSSHGADVMYWVNGGQALSARDRATMYKLYH